MTQYECLTARDKFMSIWKNKETNKKTLQSQSPDWLILQRLHLGRKYWGFPHYSIGIKYFPLVKLATKYNLQSAPNHFAKPSRKHNSSLLSKNACYIMKNFKSPLASTCMLQLDGKEDFLLLEHPFPATMTSTPSQLHNHNLETTPRCSLVPNSGCKLLLLNC